MQHKVQFKFLTPDQPHDKMTAYCRKDQKYGYHKFDANGEALSREYLEHCVEKYKTECVSYTHKKLIVTRSNVFKMCESYKRINEERNP